MPVSCWHEQIGDPTLADAILDRLVHNAYRIEMRGECRSTELAIVVPGAILTRIFWKTIGRPKSCGKDGQRTPLKITSRFPLFAQLQQQP
jgi:hypothetical protein